MIAIEDTTPFFLYRKQLDIIKKYFTSIRNDLAGNQNIFFRYSVSILQSPVTYISLRVTHLFLFSRLYRLKGQDPFFLVFHFRGLKETAGPGNCCDPANPFKVVNWTGGIVKVD